MQSLKRKIQEKEEYRKIILKTREYSSEQFDKLLVYLSSGALVLTLGFAKEIVKITDKTDVRLLIISWSLFALSLLFVLISHKTSLISMDLELAGKKKKSDRMDVITDVFNWSALISLITGITFFIIFISCNL